MPRRKIGGAQYDVVLNKVKGTISTYANADNTIKVNIHYTRLDSTPESEVKVEGIQMPPMPPTIIATVTTEDGATTTTQPVGSVTPDLTETDIIDTIFQYIGKNKIAIADYDAARSNFIDSALYALKDKWTEPSYSFDIAGSVNSGMREHYFQSPKWYPEDEKFNSFIGSFFATKPRKEVVEFAEQFGLFCVKVNNDQKQEWYVWLPRDQADSGTLPMNHNLQKIKGVHLSLVNRETVMLASGGVDKPEYTQLKDHIISFFKPAAGGSYNSKTLKELQAIAKTRKIPYSNLKKAELIAVLKKRKVGKK